MAADWTLFARTRGGVELEIADGRRLWFAGAEFEDDVPIDGPSKSCHVADAEGDHVCLLDHLHSFQRVDNTHYRVDGGASTLLNPGAAPPPDQYTLRLHADFDRPVATAGAVFYAYNGVHDEDPAGGAEVYAFENGVSSSWSHAVSVSSHLALADQPAASSHDWFICVAQWPSAAGVRTARFKAVVPYT